MEGKIRYDTVTALPASGGYYDTIGFQLVALTGCTLDEAIAAYKMLLLMGSSRRRAERLIVEIAELETAVLCNGWFVERGDGRTYVHHSVGQECPHPDHAGRGRVRKYVSDAMREGIEGAIGRWRRLETARVERLNVARELAEIERLLGRWYE